MVRVLHVSPWWYSAVRRVMAPLHPNVKIEVAAVASGEAFRFASEAVAAALERVGVGGPAEPSIVSTDGVQASEEAYEAARRKHGAKWRRP